MSNFVGFYPAGGTLSFPLVTRNSSAVPTAAESAPTFSTRSGDHTSTINTGTSAAVSGQTGVYLVTQSLATGYEAGQTYSVVVDWTMATASARKEIFRFTVV